MDEHLTGWPALYADAGARHGVFHLRRCDAYGLPRCTVEKRSARERWRSPFRGVRVLPGAADSWEQRAACRLEAVGPDAALQLRAAAHLNGMLERAPALFEIVRAHGKHVPTLAQARVRRSRTLDDGDLHVLTGLRTTTPGRTMRDLAGVLDLAPLRAIAIDGRRSGALTDEVLAALPGRMPPGGPRRRLELVVEALAGTSVDSPFALEVLEAVAGLGVPVLAEFPWRCADGRVVHLDGAVPDAWVAIECDGEGAHGGGGRQFHVDRIRWTQINRRWRLIWVTWQRWQRERAAVLREVLEAVAEAPAGRHPATRADCPCRRCR